jgi:hypothetical protein
LGLGTLPPDPDSSKSYTYSAVSDASSFTLGTTLSSGTTYVYNSSSNAWFNGIAYGQYKKSVTVLNNPSSSAISGVYPVKLTINTSALVTATKLRSDCNDLRFTDNPATTNLSYWIESGCNTASTIIWVNLPNGIPATTGTTINMYYGTQTVAASSGANTFSLFDDFLGSALNTSIWKSTGGTIAIANSICTLSGSGSYSYLFDSATVSNPIGYSIRSRATLPTGNVNLRGIFGWYDSVGGVSGTEFDGRFPTADRLNTRTFLNSNTTGVNLGTGYSGYHIFEVARNASSSAIYSIDNSVVANTTTNVPTMNEAAHLGFFGTGSSLFDWVLVRPYNSAEPTASTITFGTEGIGQ